MSVRASVFASDLALRETGGKRRTLGGWLHTIAYGVWLGGLVVIGVIVAPNAAFVIHSYPAFVSDPEAQKAILIGIIGNSFRVFNGACYFCGAAMLVSDILQGVAAESTYRQFTTARSFFTILLLGSALYLGYLLFPEMDHAQHFQNVALFNHLHNRYVLISELQLIPLLIIPALTSRRDRALDSRY
jgi:uncharacterized membrane protein